MGPAHLAAGLAAKSFTPKIYLIFLLIASEALDLLSFLFIWLGIEEPGTSQFSFVHGLQVIQPGSIAWSHSLFMAILWSFVFVSISFLIIRDRRLSMIFALVVFSHWVLDFIVHAPDLPLLFENSPKVGLGLWTTGPGFITSLMLEIILVIGGLIIYFRGRRHLQIRENKT